MRIHFRAVLSVKEIQRDGSVCCERKKNVEYVKANIAPVCNRALKIIQMNFGKMKM